LKFEYGSTSIKKIIYIITKKVFMENKAMKNNIIILIWLVILLVWWVLWYFLSTITDKKPVVDKNKVETNFSDTTDEKAEKALLDLEKQKLVEELNKSIRPNYLKITDWKEYSKLGDYTDTNTTFFSLEFQPDITDQSLADYDIRILKGSIDENDYINKSSLYKEKTKWILLNMLKKWQYSKILEKWVVWTIRRISKNQYKIDFLWDYIIDKYWTSKNISSTTAWKIALLWEYLNFWSIYLTKEQKDFSKLLDDIEKELNDKNFSTLAKNIRLIYFKQ